MKIDRSEDDPESVSLSRMRSICRRVLNRVRKKIVKQEAEMQEAGRGEWYQQIADSLMSDPARHPRGSGTVRVSNVHTGTIDEIRFNPKLDGKENAALLYKKARKARRGIAVIQRNLEQTRQEITALETMLARCDSLASKGQAAEDELGQLATDLTEMGLIGDPVGGQKASATRGIPFRHFLVDGYDVFVGRNQTQNDELSVHFAKPWDIWMHVAAHSGSHVVVRREKNGPWPPQNTLNKVSALCVWFSRAKHTSYAEVHVTEARFVRKRRKSPPGEVIAERCKNIRVAPLSPQELFSERREGMSNIG